MMDQNVAEGSSIVGASLSDHRPSTVGTLRFVAIVYKLSILFVKLQPSSFLGCQNIYAGQIFPERTGDGYI